VGRGLRAALVFTGPTGVPIWRGNFNKLVDWPVAVAAISMPGLHFHDLRHTGNTFAARTGASTRELMARIGHDSTQAAIIYQHANDEADRAIAQAVDIALKADRKTRRRAAGRKVKKRADDRTADAEDAAGSGP
jgi:integrase